MLPVEILWAKPQTCFLLSAQLGRAVYEDITLRICFGQFAQIFRFRQDLPDALKQNIAKTEIAFFAHN